MRIPQKHWFIGFVLEPALAPVSMRSEAEQWRDRPFRGHLSRTPQTFRSACRKARRWNRRRSAQGQPGTWEVFGPLGKGED